MSKSSRTARRTFGVLAGAALLVTGSASVAGAVPTAEDGTLAAAPPAGCRPYVETSYAISCYEYNGDDQWIRDKVANGWQAVVHIQTNYGKNRYCGSLPKADGWGQCSYDHREDGCVRFRFYELKDGVTRGLTEFSPYYHASNGTRC